MSPVAAVVAVWLLNKVFPAYWIVPCFGHAGLPVCWGCLMAFCLFYCPLFPLQFWLFYDEFEHEIRVSYGAVFLIYRVYTGICVCSPTFRWISLSSSSGLSRRVDCPGRLCTPPTIQISSFSKTSVIIYKSALSPLTNCWFMLTLGQSIQNLVLLCSDRFLFWFQTLNTLKPVQFVLLHRHCCVEGWDSQVT